MRVLIACLVVAAAAAPAAAQDYLALGQARDAERVAGEQAARQRDIVLSNEVSRLDAQAQTNQALAGLAAQQMRAVLPAVPRDPKAAPVIIDARKLVSIPDAVLADSNAKVRAASENRR